MLLRNGWRAPDHTGDEVLDQVRSSCSHFSICVLPKVGPSEVWARGYRLA